MWEQYLKWGVKWLYCSVGGGAGGYGASLWRWLGEKNHIKCAYIWCLSHHVRLVPRPLNEEKLKKKKEKGGPVKRSKLCIIRDSW